MIESTTTEDTEMGSELLKAVAELDLESADAAELFDAIYKKVAHYRDAHGDAVPLGIFPAVRGIGGGGATREVAVLVYSKSGNEFKGYALLHRGAEFQGWQNTLHIPGVTLRSRDTREKQWERLSERIFGARGKLDEGGEWAQEGRFYLAYDPIYDEHRERHSMCQAALWILELYEDEAEGLTEGWEIITDLDDSRIIEHHRTVLKALKI